MARIVLYLLIFVVLTAGILCADSNDTTPSPAKTEKPATATEKPNVSINEFYCYNIIIIINYVVIFT